MAKQNFPSTLTDAEKEQLQKALLTPEDSRTADQRMMIEKLQAAEAPVTPAASAPAPPAGPTADLTEPLKRNFQKEVEKIHDLFELIPTHARKNVSFNPQIPQIENILHQHFFHSIDSHGIVQEFSVPTAGHKHRIEIKKNPQGEITGFVCGTALRENNKRTAGGNVISELGSIRLGEDPKTGEAIIDAHVHVMSYKRSEKLKVALR